MIKVVIVGYGNLGRYAVNSIKSTADMKCLGIIRRSVSDKNSIIDGIGVYSSIDNLIVEQGKPDVAILCLPSRVASKEAKEYLTRGINTVDSFDIHQDIVSTIHDLEPSAKLGSSVAIVAAGWDPGTDSVLRAYLEAMCPIGTTFTNFGPGRSMGHSVAARNIKGVKDAIALTMPLGAGKHSRVVYICLDEGASLSEVTARIGEDAYFKNDQLTVIKVDTVCDLNKVADSSHGVLMQRSGGVGSVSNQRFTFSMEINNPALTSQVLVSAARATCRMVKGGVYTLLDVPPVYMLEGDREQHIRRLV